MGASVGQFTPSKINLEISSLVWLDGSVNTLQESRDAQQQLRLMVKRLEAFERVDLCEKHIKSLSETDQIILIVSGALGREIVPRIHQNRQIVSIYVYCGNRQNNEQWIKEFPKIRGLAVQLDELISKIKSDQVKQEESKSSEPLTFTTYNSNTNKEKLTAELNGQFVHSQLLIDCLLHIESNPTDMKELVRICRQEYQNDKEELALVQEFQGHYSKNEVVTWYTREAFVYRMLNRALRAQNIHLLFLFRFLIRDLESQLIDNQCQSRITVYRGQLMWAKEFESLKRSSGELISINSYLSTSLNRDLAYKFLRQPTDLERILFEIDADPRLHGIKPFANISQLSCYAKEQEVLFMLGSMFKLGDITHDRNSVWTVKLTLCGDRDLNLKELVEHMKSQDGKEN